MEPELDETLLPLKRISEVSQIPIHDLLLTAWVQVLCEHFNLQEVVINLVMHGRGIEEDDDDDEEKDDDEEEDEEDEVSRQCAQACKKNGGGSIGCRTGIRRRGFGCSNS